MARKKRRFEQLEAAAATPTEKKIYTNRFQQEVGERLDDAGKKLEGKGKTILYGIAALIVLLILIGVFVRWSRHANADAEAALGKAIDVAGSPVSDTAPPEGSTQRTFKTEKERADAAIPEFQAVVDKFGGAVGEKAKYFIAVNNLMSDRQAGIQQLEALTVSNSDVGKLAKFALAQTRVADNRLDDAVALYQELAGMDNAVVAKDTINFELAKIYEKQDKKKEAADLYYNIAKSASEAKDMDGKPIKMSETGSSAKDKLKQLAPDRAAEIVETQPDAPSGGAMPINFQ